MWSEILKIRLFVVIGLYFISLLPSVVEAGVPKETFYKGYPYTDALARKFYTMRGYCDEYSAWRRGRSIEEDGFFFDVSYVIDVDGTNIQCWGTLTQRMSGYAQTTYIPTTAYKVCPENSSNYYADTCDCNYGFHEIGGQCRRKPEICPGVDGFGTPNPILIGSGEKYLREADFTDFGGGSFGFLRNYLHQRASNNAGMGAGWAHNFADHLFYQPKSDATSHQPAKQEEVLIDFGSGQREWFSLKEGKWHTQAGQAGC